MKNFGYLIYLVLVVFVLSEMALRFRHSYDTYSEGIGTGYSNNYGRTNPTKFLVHVPNRDYVPVNNDFSYAYSTNQFGIREKKLQPKSENTIRIFTSGDSFSEGVGAPYDSTWPHQLEKFLTTDSLKVEVLNIGVAGSDPIYNYFLYRDSLQKFAPDFLILPINSSDFTDYLVRGGFERVNQDGSETFRKAPWYEPLYHYSRWFRVFAHYSTVYPYRGIFSTQQDMLDNIDSTMQCFETAIDSFQKITAHDSTKIIVLFYCSPAEILNTDTIHNKIGISFSQLEQKLQQRGIASINIWNEMMEKFIGHPYQEFTYPNDRHYNPNGYNYMAQCIAQKMKDQKLLLEKLPAY